MTSSTPSSAPRVIVWMCAAHVVSMLGFSAYPTLLPRLQVEWGMSNAWAGLLSGIFFGGYMLAVPVLSSLTDRIDARRIYLASSLASVTAGLGFALFARGPWSALAFQLFAGVGIAGTYMPGLRVLTDNLSGRAQSRAVSFYTAVFGFGTSLSILFAGFIADAFGWRYAFAVAALGSLAAGAMVLGGMPPHRPQGRAGAKLLDFRPVLRNRDTSAYIYGYAVHCWELFGSRAWMVAFLVFCQMRYGAAWPLSPVLIAAMANLLGPFSSVSGNEFAMRHGRPPLIRAVMAVSGLVTCAVGFLAALPWFLILGAVMLHMVLVMGDSSALTAGMVERSDPATRGAAMAVHSTLGFAAGFVAPLVFGLALDWGGGNASATAWAIAFVTLGVGGMVAPFLLRLRG